MEEGEEGISDENGSEEVQPCSLPGSHTPSVPEEQREAPVDTTDSGKG